MSAPDRKPDRRVARTIALLRDALMALILEKGYDTITVQDITDRANVARTTFYLHFKDKDELLFVGMREIYQDLIDRTKAQTSTHSLLELVGEDSTVDFTHVAQHADFYRIMLSERGSMAFFMRVHGFLAQMMLDDVLKPLVSATGTAPPMPLPMVAHYLAGAQLGAIKWWLEDGMHEPAQAMGRMTETLCTDGLFRALAVNPLEVTSE